MEATLCVCVVEFCLTVVYGLKTYKTNRSLSFVAEQEFYILIAKLKPEGFWVYWAFRSEYQLRSKITHITLLIITKFFV